MADKKVVEIGGNSRELDRELGRSKRLVQDLRQEVDRLNQSLQQLGRSTIGQGMGRTPASTGTAQTFRPTMQANSPGNVLSGALLQQKQLFQVIARGSKEALTAMTSSLRTESTHQQQHIQRLKKEVDGLATSYRQLERLHRSGMVSTEMLHEGRSALFEGAGKLGEATAHGRGLHMAQLRARAQGGPGKWGARAGLAWEETKDFASSVPARMGIGPGVAQFGIAAAIGYAAGKVIVNTMKSGMAEAQAAPHDYQNREISRGAFGRAAQGIRGGDYTLVHALQTVARDNRLRADLRAAGGGGEMGVTGFGRGTGGGITFNEGGYRTMGAIWNLTKRALSLDPIGASNEFRREMGNIPYEQAQEKLRMAQRVQEMRPEDFARLHAFQANTGANISHMNTFGRGAGYYTRSGRRLNRGQMGIVNQMTDLGAGGIDNVEYRNNAQRMLDRVRRQYNISPEELAGGYGAVEGVGGFGTAQQLGLRAALAARGHMGGAGGILATAAMTGDAGAFWTNMNNMVGRGSGGMDVGAAQSIGGTVAGSLTNGAAPTSGLGLMSAMGAYGRGDNSAQDMLNARFMGAGLGAMGSMFGGRTDPYQRGVNLLSAIRAAPGASVGAQEYLSQLDPRVIFDIAGGGQVPYELQARGITGPMVQQYSRTVLSRMSDRAIGASPNQGGSLDPTQRQTRAVQQRFGGSFSAYMRTMRTPEEQKRALVERGAFLQEAGFASSDLEGQGFARLEAGLGTKPVTKTGAGRGISDFSIGSSDRLKEQKDAEMAESEHRATEQMDVRLRGTISRAKVTADSLSGMGGEDGGGLPIKQVGMALNRLVGAFNMAASELEVASGRLRARH